MPIIDVRKEIKPKLRRFDIDVCVNYSGSTIYSCMVEAEDEAQARIMAEEEAGDNYEAGDFSLDSTDIDDITDNGEVETMPDATPEF